jgi:N-methylhydantoinase B
MRLGKRSDVPIREGDVACSIPAGGAGFGDPRRRDPRRVAWDVLNEYVSLERARDVYGVVVDETTGDVDEKQTQELRSM